MMNQRYKSLFDCILIAGIVLLVYYSVYSIPFLYFEKAGIQYSPIVVNMDLFFERMLTLKGLFQRPLSMFTYTLNYFFSGESTFYYHLVNLVVHITNAILVYFIAKRSLSKNYLFAALLFALHPVATACASKLHGRFYSLGTMFMLLFFLLYIKWKEAGTINIKRYCVLATIFILMLLSKQSLIFLPIIILWYEIYKGNIKINTRFYAFSIISVVVTLLFIFIYALPYSEKAIVGPWTFFLSQMGNLLTLISFYILPFQTALIHDLNFYGTIYPQVALGILITAVMIYLAFKYRKRTSGFLLGALIISIFPTNSFMPKDDIINEWRLYPSLIFFCILFVHLLNHILKNRIKLYYIVAVCYLALFSYSVIRQNNIYQSEASSWEQIVNKYPTSDSFSNLGRAYALDGKLALALKNFTKAKEMDPTNYAYYRNIAQVYSDMGNSNMANNYLEQSNKVALDYGFKTYSYTILK